MRTSVKICRLKIEELLRFIDSKSVAIPGFQRGYVWRVAQIKNLFDESVQKYVDEYDDNCFWEELFYRMSGRDFKNAYSRKEISKMEMKERFEKE